MSKTFLYRLYKKSTLFFVLSILFIAAYAIMLHKKMDLLFFPYNSMFSENFAKDYTSTTFALKLNDTLINITNDVYLKKDFSEMSLATFSKWAENNNNLYMHQYLTQKIKDSFQLRKFTDRLVPNKNVATTWLKWYAAYHGKKIQIGDTFQISKYNFFFLKNEIHLTDSSIILKQCYHGE